MLSTATRIHAHPSLVAAIAALGMLGGLAAAPVHAGAGGFSVGRSHGHGGVGFGYSTVSGGQRAAFQYDLIEPDNNTMAVDGEQSWRTIGKLEDEVKRTGNDILWVSIEGREYAIRDARLVGRAHEIVEPMARLGAEQGRLGSMQGDLGRQQGAIGALQGQVGALQARLADLEVRAEPGHRAELTELRRQLDEVTQQVRALGVKQRTLGMQQQELGRQQRELGEQQRRASLLAFDQLKTLTDQAIASGKAEALEAD